MAESSSSWSLGEYAVSPRSDLRSTANFAPPPTSPRRPMARGALVRLQGRDGYRTSDKSPSLACHASASITGCVRKSLLRLRPSACLTRDHRLGLAQRPKPDWRYTPLFGCEAKLAVERRSEAGEPTVAREHVCGPSVILTTSVKGAREGARVKIMLVGCPQTAGRASRSGEGLAFGHRRLNMLYYRSCSASTRKYLNSIPTSLGRE